VGGFEFALRCFYVRGSERNQCGAESGWIPAVVARAAAAFHEAVGAIFAVLALSWVNAGSSRLARDAARWLVAIPVAVALLFVFFAVTSFRKARRL